MEALIAKRGVDEWVESLGHSIARHHIGAAQKNARDREAVRDESAAAGLISDWSLSLDGYRRGEALRRTPRGRHIILDVQDSLRDAADPALVLARRWARWSRARMGPEAQAVCVVWQLASEAVFEIAHARSDEALAQLNTPSPELLASLLDDAGAFEWLECNGAAIPECLTDRSTT